MNYIGIRGHRGAGKSSVARLLSFAIDYILENKPQDDFSEKYKAMCEGIMQDESFTDGGYHTYIDSFSDSIRVLVAMLLGVDCEEISDHNKDRMVINLKDFSNIIYEKGIPKDIKLTKYTDAFQMVSLSTGGVVNYDIFMTLRDFILYFAREVMQIHFGINVWIKVLEANTNDYWYDGLDYRIFRDVKTPSEVTYIKKKAGIIVKVNRPGHIKKSGSDYDMLKDDDRFDYEITMTDNLEDSEQNIYNLAKKIIEKFNGSKDN